MPFTTTCMDAIALHVLNNGILCRNENVQSFLMHVLKLIKAIVFNHRNVILSRYNITATS